MAPQARHPTVIAARKRAVIEYGAVRRRHPQLSVEQSVALWNRQRALMTMEKGPRKGLCRKNSTLRADLRHLREGLLREPDGVDIYRFPRVRDLRDAFEAKAKHDPVLTATMVPERGVRQLLLLTPPSTALAVLCLAAVGATRHAELTRSSTTITMDPSGDAWTIRRVPKRSPTIRLAAIPRCPFFDQLITRGCDGAGRPMVDGFREVSSQIKKIARICAWGPGKWTTYSVRRRGLDVAVMCGFGAEEIRAQSAHQREVPATYFSNRNPHLRRQLPMVRQTLETMMGSGEQLKKMGSAGRTSLAQPLGRESTGAQSSGIASPPFRSTTQRTRGISSIRLGITSSASGRSPARGCTIIAQAVAETTKLQRRRDAEMQRDRQVQHARALAAAMPVEEMDDAIPW
jgi:hypothetical protein